MASSFYKVTKEGVEIRIRATPNASNDEVICVEKRDDSLSYLKVKVRAIADDNAANIAIAKLLSKLLNVSKSAAEIKAGQKSRTKTLLVKGDSFAIEEAILNIVSQIEGGK